MNEIQGIAYRGLRLATAICVASSIALPAVTAHAQVDTYATASAPWIIVCERRPCVDNERATNTFFNMIHEQSREWTGANPYFLSATDWNSLTAVAAESNQLHSTPRHSSARRWKGRREPLENSVQLTDLSWKAS
jgi:hypothetical protein